MALNYNFATLFLLCFLAAGGGVFRPSAAKLVQEQPLVMKYHNGTVLKGKITINLIWYGKFTPTQRSVIVDFLESLNSLKSPSPSAASWWKITGKYGGKGSEIVLGKQILDENYSIGKSLKNYHIRYLAGKTEHLAGAVNLVLTAKDVFVDGFCMSRCGTHGSTRVGSTRFAYAWVGDSETQCPGYCAWPFHQPVYGPQTVPLVAPNGDVGVDGMIINIATVLAGAVLNPYNNGYFYGPAAAPVEAVSACTGVFGSGSYPGYPGQVLTDELTGASFNAYGVNGRKFLIPAMWDPQKSACAPLV